VGVRLCRSPRAVGKITFTSLNPTVPNNFKARSRRRDGKREIKAEHGSKRTLVCREEAKRTLVAASAVPGNLKYGSTERKVTW
jgi:hypothetical protein